MADTAAASGQAEAGLSAGAIGGGNEETAKAAAVPGPQESEKLIEQNVTGQLPKDGAYGRSIGRVLGNPASYVGPGGLPAKILAGVATGTTAQAGKDLTENTPLAPYGEFAGSVVGGYGAGKVASTASNIMRARQIPTTAQLRTAADNAYAGARALNPEYQPSTVDNLRNTIEADLTRQGHRNDLSGATFRRVGEIAPVPGTNPNFSDIEGVRQSLNMVRQEVHPTTGRPTADARAAGVAVDHIDDFLADHTNAIPGHQNIAREAAELAEEGRGNWASMSRSQQIEQALGRGTNNAAATGSGANVDNALRQQVKNILNNPRRARNFTADDRTIMQDIVSGNPVRNSARLLGKMAATGIVSLAGVEYLSHVMGLGPAGHLLVPAAGYAAKKAGDVMTQNRIGRLLQAIRTDSPLGATRNIPDRATTGPYVARAALTSPYGDGPNPYQP